MSTRGFGAALLLGVAAALAKGAAPPPAETAERAKARAEAWRLNAQGGKLYEQGKLAEAAKVCVAALRLTEKLYPQAQFPDGHPDLATTLYNLASVLGDLRGPGQARPHYERALAMRRKLFSEALFPNGHPDVATTLNDLGVVADQLGDARRALSYYQQALAMYRKLYPEEICKDGHEDLATSLGNVGIALQEMGEPRRALPYLEEGLAMRRRLFPEARFPKGHPDLANSLNSLGTVLVAMGEPARALPFAEQAVAMRQALYPREGFPDGHPLLAKSLTNLGGTLHAMGDSARAVTHFERALAMLQRLYPEAQFPNGRPELAMALGDLGVVLYATGDRARALPYHEQALALSRKLYPGVQFPNGHPQLTQRLTNLGNALMGMGEPRRALPYYEQALAMSRKLFPIESYKNGHPLLALSLGNLGAVLSQLGEPKRALGPSEEALAMFRKVYPEDRYKDGHPQLAQCLNNVGFLRLRVGGPKAARPSFEEALAMYRRLYPRERVPDGHPELVMTLSNLAFVVEDPAEALRHFEEALAISRRLYPEGRFKDGHPLLALSLNNLSGALEARGQLDRALTCSEQSLAMYQRLAAEVARHASEAQALNHAASLPLARDAYLSLTRRLGQDAYPLVWQLRGHLGRVYERRHLATLSARDDKARALFDEVVRLRRLREHLILAPAPADVKARDERLAELDRRIGERDRELRRQVPALAGEEKLAGATPADLRAALPSGAVFLDFLRYVHFDKNGDTQADTRTPSYVAFVVRRDRVERAELGPAGPIEEAIKLWRQAIREGTAGERHAQSLRRLVWEPIARHLPADTRTVYLAPDMALSALPWAALPGRRADDVLLAEYDLCLVPHGPWLLGRLAAPQERPAGRPTLLAVGGVAYGAAPPAASVAARRSPPSSGKLWGELGGTAKEVEQVGKLAGGFDLHSLRAGQAGAVALLKALPGARCAHLATHGFFADSEFRSALQLDEKLFARREATLGQGARERVGAGARSPMVLSGLVCAGANRDGTPNRGILTADAVSRLDLRQMHLAVLSACETGLGETAGGEGVFGLQRAFHIGGCRNVVASLWKVPDEATAALMNRFYSYLWHSAKPMTPREALRRAMLDLYQHPEQVAEWSAVRGANLKVVVEGSGTKSAAPRPAAGKTAPPKLWAAWVLSGPGD